MCAWCSTECQADVCLWLICSSVLQQPRRLGFLKLRLLYITENLSELEALARIPALRRTWQESPQVQIQPVYMSGSRLTRTTEWVVVEDRNQQIWEFQDSQAVSWAYIEKGGWGAGTDRQQTDRRPRHCKFLVLHSKDLLIEDLNCVCHEAMCGLACIHMHFLPWFSVFNFNFWGKVFLKYICYINIFV